MRAYVRLRRNVQMLLSVDVVVCVDGRVVVSCASNVASIRRLHVLNLGNAYTCSELFASFTGRAGRSVSVCGINV